MLYPHVVDSMYKLVKLTTRPSVTDDMHGLNSLFDAIADDEASARSPTVPTSPYSEHANPPPPGCKFSSSSSISCK
jgi:hypothetical protein